MALQGSAFASWAEALLPDQIILRILWIVGNTMNSTLFEKVCILNTGIYVVNCTVSCSDIFLYSF